jgi:hypothetical protein
VILDAFINFKPFHFRAEISLEVGVECDIGKIQVVFLALSFSSLIDLDILFIHIHVSIHLGADLTLWGPHDFGGHAYVDFWFFGFGINFGASENPNVTDPISLVDFYGMVKAPGPASAPPSNDKIASDPDVAQHKYSVEAGLIPALVPLADGNDFPSTGATSEWQVQAGTLQFRIDCDFALSDAHFVIPDPNGDSSTINQSISLPAGGVQTIPNVYSWPMHSSAANNITSTLEIWIYQIEDPTNPILQSRFKAELVLKSAATALWSVWDPNNDPLHSNQPTALLDGSNATVNLVQAVRIFPPDPFLCLSPIVQFDATAAMRETISGTFQIPPKEEQGTLFCGAYFEPSAPDTTDGQTQRWTDFGNMWNPAAPAPAAPATGTGTAGAAPASTFTGATATGTSDPNLPAIRAGMVGLIATVLEWNFRPPEQMTGNSPSTTDGNPPAGGSSLDGGTTASMSSAANAPRINADGRTDWQLLDVPPPLLVENLAIYYPVLPYVTTLSA